MTQLFRIALLLLTVHLCCLKAEAQFLQASSDKAALVFDRILLVESEDFECMPSLESAFKSHWKGHQQIQFKSAEDINQLLIPSEAKKYAVLTGDKRQEMRSVKGRYEYADVITLALYLGENAGRRNDLPLDRNFVAKYSIPFCLSSDSELKMIANCLQEQLRIMASKPTSSGRMKKPAIATNKTKSMATKTMLFSASMLDCSEDELKAVYPYPFKMVSDEELKKAILEGGSAQMVLNIAWSDRKFRWSLMAFDLSEYMPLVEVRFLDAKPNFVKKNFDATQEFLAIQKGKKKLSAANMKSVANEIKKALAK